MSRIGKHAVELPAGVKVDIVGQVISASGKLGTLDFRAHDEVSLSLDDGKISVQPRNDSKVATAMWGMCRTRVSNLVQGVSDGFSRELAISGVGYRAAIAGKVLNLQLGFSHDIKVAIPEDLDVKCPTPTQIIVSGADKQKVGQLAATVRGFRPPEPYKGKGVRYADETILRKEGKKK